MNKITLLIFFVVVNILLAFPSYSQSDSTFYILDDVSINTKIKKNVWISNLNYKIKKDISSISDDGKLGLVQGEDNLLISLINGATLYNFKKRKPFFDNKGRIFFIEDGFLKELTNYANIISRFNLNDIVYDRYLSFKGYLIFSQNIENSNLKTYTNNYLDLNSFELKSFNFQLESGIETNLRYSRISHSMIEQSTQKFCDFLANLSDFYIERISVLQSFYYQTEIFISQGEDGRNIDAIILRNEEVLWIHDFNVRLDKIRYMGRIEIPDYSHRVPSYNQPNLMAKNGFLYLIMRRFSNSTTNLIKLNLSLDEILGNNFRLEDGSVSFFDYQKINLKPYKDILAGPSSYNSKVLIKIDSNENIYLNSKSNNLYKFKFNDELNVNTEILPNNLVNDYREFYKNQTNNLTNYGDSILSNKTNFDEPYDLYSKISEFANSQKLLGEGFETENRAKMLSLINYDTIPLKQTLIPELYSLKDEIWQVYISKKNYNIPLKLKISSELAKKISKTDSHNSFWVITKSFSILSFKNVPIKAELYFEGERIYKQIIPEYSYQILDNLSFSNNKYLTNAHPQILDSSIYSLLVSPGQKKNNMDYSNGLNIKNINDKKINHSFNDEKSWFDNSRLIDCCPRKTDYIDGKGGINVYFDNTGYALNVNLPYCKGNRKYLIDNTGYPQLIKEDKGCFNYWYYNNIKKLYVESKWEKGPIQKNKYSPIINTYIKGVLNIKNSTDSIIAEINLLPFYKKDKNFKYYPRFSPDGKYLALLIYLSSNRVYSSFAYMYVYSTSNGNVSFQIKINEAAKVKLYWDKTSSLLGFNNLLFQIPTIVKFENDDKYKYLIFEADKMFEIKNFELSLKLFKKAQRIKAEEHYPIEQIRILEPIIAKIKLDEEYKNSIKEADNFFTLNDFNASLELYEKAHSLKENEIYPSEKIKEIKAILIEIKIKELDEIANNKKTKIISYETFTLEKQNFKQFKQLYKSVKSSYDIYKNELLNPYIELINNIDNKDSQIENLESYILGLNRIILFHEKIQTLLETEELTIFQKKLKNLLEPKEIFEIILAY